MIQSLKLAMKSRIVLVLIALGLAMATFAIVNTIEATEAQAHKTCRVDGRGAYTGRGLSHFHGGVYWYVNTARSSYGGPGAYLAWYKMVGTNDVPGTYMGTKWCAGY
jgi:hypothetical protein